MFIIRVALNESMSFIKKKKNENVLIETKAEVVFLLSLGRSVTPCILFNIYIVIMVIKFNISRFFACCRERRDELRVEGQAQRNGK